MILNTMPRSILKLVLSAAVAATLAASPVQARDATDGDDSAAIVAALLGLVTLGVLLSENDDKPSYHGHVSRPYDPTPPRRDHRVSKRKALPERCLREFRTQTGRKVMFGNRCLERNFKYASDLPRSCKRNLVVKNRKGIYVNRKVYKPACLSKRGYRIVHRY
ncbi:hypothetical protein [uncultured Aliiroseovarius sp.]|uniref:hypothetical protein n=1 Tax=uncultured Aliiroseovarius sp. TaxID=1658783 RepID=UPI002608A12E|nr:hypothetical protein [uncultured Aliiroseovarius sp.]